jgi:hypothetical protein
MTTMKQRVDETIQRLADLDPIEARETWLDGLLWADIGEKLSCTEAEALGVLIILAGGFDGDVAHLIVECHGSGDCEPTDLHGHEEAR